MADEGTLKVSCEALVDSINATEHRVALMALGDHIQRTRILWNHDNIIEAWKAKAAELDLTHTEDVVRSIEAQKP